MDEIHRILPQDFSLIFNKMYFRLDTLLLNFWKIWSYICIYIKLKWNWYKLETYWFSLVEIVYWIICGSQLYISGPSTYTLVQSPPIIFYLAPDLLYLREGRRIEGVPVKD